jgi:hypothetical protein
MLAEDGQRLDLHVSIARSQKITRIISQLDGRTSPIHTIAKHAEGDSTEAP